MNKRVVILWVCFFVWAVSLMAQDVPGGVVAAFKKGNSQELNGYLSDKVELILESFVLSILIWCITYLFATFLKKQFTRKFPFAVVSVPTMNPDSSRLP